MPLIELHIVHMNYPMSCMFQLRTLSAEHMMSNNFAFGGINTSLIFRQI